VRLAVYAGVRATGAATGHVRLGAVVLWALVILWLGRGSRVAWGLLLLLNVYPLVGLGFINGAGVISAKSVVVFASFAALIGTLLSRPMREHVGFGTGSPGRFLRAHRV
jgi:hypothetical protein